MGKLSKGIGHRADGKGARIDDFAGGKPLRGQCAGAVGHSAVRQRRPVLDNQHAAIANLLTADNDQFQVRFDNLRGGIASTNIPSHLFDFLRRSPADLVDHDDVGGQKIRFPRIMSRELPRPAARRRV